MSIFSTLRYPISMPPTYEELRALPAEVYDQWISEITPDGLGLASILQDRVVLADVFKKSAHENVAVAILRLQTIIYGLDE